MKIGIYFAGVSAALGGGFTFQETVLRSLLLMPREFRFTIFHYGRRPTQIVEGPNIRYVSLAGIRPLRIFLKLFFSLIGRRLQYASYRLSKLCSVNLPFPYGSPLDRMTRKLGIDLVWFPTPESEWTDVPYVATVWDLEHRVQPYFPEVSLRGEWEHRERRYSEMLPRASFIITGTKVGMGEIVRHYGLPEKRIRLLPHPVPSFTESVTKSKSNSSKPYVLYPAQFWSHKNHFYLLEAAKILRDKKSPVRFILVGSDQGNKSYIRDLVMANRLEATVEFSGFVSREKLISLYQNALALVYPSLCGPENLPPLEAFALGCPVIASDIEGSREQLGKAALLVDGTNAAAIAGAIELLRAKPTIRNRLIQNGYKRASSYGQREFAADLQNIFNDFSRIRSLWSSN